MVKKKKRFDVKFSYVYYSMGHMWSQYGDILYCDHI